MQIKLSTCTAASIVAYRTTIDLPIIGGNSALSSTFSHENPGQEIQTLKSQGGKTLWQRDLGHSPRKRREGRSRCQLLSYSSLEQGQKCFSKRKTFRHGFDPNRDNNENAIQARETVLHVWGNSRANRHAPRSTHPKALPQTGTYWIQSYPTGD